MNNKINIEYKKLTENAIVPNKLSSTIGSAGYDLSTNITDPITIQPHTAYVFSTGVAIHIKDDSYVGLVYGRSGLGFKHNVTLSNCVGVIDSDYTGEIKVSLINHSDIPYTVNPSDKIAQLIITPIMQIEFTEVESLDNTDRNDNGFGSSGK